MNAPNDQVARKLKPKEVKRFTCPREHSKRPEQNSGPGLQTDVLSTTPFPRLHLEPLTAFPLTRKCSDVSSIPGLPDCTLHSTDMICAYSRAETATRPVRQPPHMPLFTRKPEQAVDPTRRTAGRSLIPRPGAVCLLWEAIICQGCRRVCATSTTGDVVLRTPKYYWQILHEYFLQAGSGLLWAKWKGRWALLQDSLPCWAGLRTGLHSFSTGQDVVEGMWRHSCCTRAYTSSSRLCGSPRGLAQLCQPGKLRE